jgi:hypothetical protein
LDFLEQSLASSVILRNADNPLAIDEICGAVRSATKYLDIMNFDMKVGAGSLGSGPSIDRDG